MHPSSTILLLCKVISYHKVYLLFQHGNFLIRKCICSIYLITVKLAAFPQQMHKNTIYRVYNFQVHFHLHLCKWCFAHCRDDWNAEEGQPESGHADGAGAVPRRVRLLSPFMDPTWGVRAVLHTGINVQHKYIIIHNVFNHFHIKSKDVEVAISQMPPHICNRLP